MKVNAQPLLLVLLFSFILIFQFSCSKDSDLLTDYVLVDAKQDLVIGKFVVNDTFETQIDNSIVLDVLANDTFENIEEVIVAETTAPANGTVEINADNTLTYTPETTGETVDTFSYTTEVVNPDETISTETGNVTVNVTEDSNKTSPTTDLGELLAFPGAVGHGRYATGGRGGSIYQVTNLNDSGTGSFRDAVSKGNRTVVFRVGGIINIESRLYFGGSNITIAGETAPGDGIAIYGSMTDTNQHENIIIRYVNFLVGDKGVVGDDDALRVRRTDTGTASNFIFDHCGFYWGKDENLAFESNSSETSSIENVTVQNCIIGESLNSRGMILWRQNYNISVIRNLFSNNSMRSIRASTRYSTFEMINNVIYNYDWATNPTYENVFDVIGNVYESSSSNNIVQLEASTNNAPVGSISKTSAYISDNTFNDGKGGISSSLTPYLQNSRQVSSGYAPLANDLVENKVLNDVGANLNGNNTLAQSQIDDVINNTGSFISSESGSVGLFLSGGTAYPDADSDGMDDNWETANGLNPNDASDGNADSNDDGYTNLEVFLYDLTTK